MPATAGHLGSGPAKSFPASPCARQGAIGLAAGSALKARWPLPARAAPGPPRCRAWPGACPAALRPARKSARTPCGTRSPSQSPGHAKPEDGRPVPRTLARRTESSAPANCIASAPSQRARNRRFGAGASAESRLALGVDDQLTGAPISAAVQCRSSTVSARGETIPVARDDCRRARGFKGGDIHEFMDHARDPERRICGDDVPYGVLLRVPRRCWSGFRRTVTDLGAY
jgi:hypothetical protein